MKRLSPTENDGLVSRNEVRKTAVLGRIARLIASGFLLTAPSLLWADGPGGPNGPDNTAVRTNIQTAIADGRKEAGSQANFFGENAGRLTFIEKDVEDSLAMMKQLVFRPKDIATVNEIYGELLDLQSKIVSAATDRAINIARTETSKNLPYLRRELDDIEQQAGQTNDAGKLGELLTQANGVVAYLVDGGKVCGGEVKKAGGDAEDAYATFETLFNWVLSHAGTRQYRMG